MNIAKTLLAVGIMGICLVAVILTGGLLLPFAVPFFFYGAKLMGVKME